MSGRLTVDLPDDVHRNFKARAALEGVTMVEIVRHLLNEVLADPKRFELAAAKARDEGPARSAP